MGIILKEICKADILKDKDSDILITLNSKLSLSQAQLVNNVKQWYKF